MSGQARHDEAGKRRGIEGYGYGGDPHAPCNVDDAAGYLAPVGDQDFGEHQPSTGSPRMNMPE